MSDNLNEPHGGKLVDPMVDESGARELKEASRGWPSWSLCPRQLCDLELLLNGGLSPLEGFMDRATHDAVVAGCRLPDDSVWPMPVVLDVDADFAQKLPQVFFRDTDTAVEVHGQVDIADHIRHGAGLAATDTHPGSRNGYKNDIVIVAAPVRRTLRLQGADDSEWYVLDTNPRPNG